MYSNNILNFQESTTILNACTKKAWRLIECTTYVYKLINLYNSYCRDNNSNTTKKAFIRWWPWRRVGLKQGFGANASLLLTQCTPAEPYNIFIYLIMCSEGNVVTIIIIMLHCQHSFPWPLLATHLYLSSLLRGLPGYILYQHRAVVYRF